MVGKDRSVIVEIYSPWCGHCQNFHPTYEELWDHYKSPQSEDFRENLVIAKLNGPNNRDICAEFGIFGYPTIFIFGKENNVPISTFKGKGSRTLENLISWADTALSDDFVPEEFVI